MLSPDRHCVCCWSKQSLHWAEASSLLCGCHSLVTVGVCSPVVGVEALRVGFDQTPLPLNVSPALKGVIVEENEAHVITKTLCVTCVGVHSSTQK